MESRPSLQPDTAGGRAPALRRATRSLCSELRSGCTDCAKQSPGWRPLQKVMRIVQSPDNGNVAAVKKNGVESRTNTENGSWLFLNNTNQLKNCNIIHENHNKSCNNFYVLINNKEVTDTLHNTQEHHTADVIVETGICNRQYRINNQNEYTNANEKLETSKLDSHQENSLLHCDSPPDSTPNEVDHTFEYSDTDEMTENVQHSLPRGIVNPNYPGFQHLAHTLQDYSSNIETFYQSENEMTDDDIDADIVDMTHTLETNKNEIIDYIKQDENELRNASKFRRPPAISSSARRSSSDRKTTIATKSSKSQNTTTVPKHESPKYYDLESFDVYNIETALPKIDLDAIENHLKAAKEAERRKRNDREEIRKRLAMDADNDEYYSLGHTDRPGKKPSLHSRLQNGKNLQICFMNETASDNESQASDIEKNLHCSSKSLSRPSIFGKSSSHNHPYQTRPLSVNITKNDKISNAQTGNKFRPSSFILKSSKSCSTQSLNHIDVKETDFYTLQATLQTEARIALAQAKEMAHVQMERERLSRAVSPVTEMLRRSMEKANAPLAPDRRRVSRQLLTDMNIAQLQVIVNELHSQIESLNDTLVKLLMARDELHMGQDSMLVDIEDLTRYLGVKEQTKKTKGTTKSAMRRLTSLVQK
ncbi:unnamed protein product, partial [Iphiclides podalirius]